MLLAVLATDCQGFAGLMSAGAGGTRVSLGELPDLSKGRSAFVFKVECRSNVLAEPRAAYLNLEDGGNRFLRNVRESPTTASNP